MHKVSLLALALSLSACGLVKGQFSTSTGPTSTSSQPSGSTTSPSPGAPAAQDDYYVKRAKWSEMMKPLAALVDLSRAAQAVINVDVVDAAAARKYTSAQLVAAGTQCDVEVKKSYDAGIEYSVDMPTQGTSVRLLEAAKYCEWLREGGAHFDQNVADSLKEQASEDKRHAREKSESEARETAEVAEIKLLKSLIAGDKLAYILERRGFDLYGKGQVSITTPKQIAATSVFFQPIYANYTWTLYRFEFRGNTMVSQTREGSVVEPGPRAYR